VFLCLCEQEYEASQRLVVKRNLSNTGGGGWRQGAEADYSGNGANDPCAAGYYFQVRTDPRLLFYSLCARRIESGQPRGKGGSSGWGGLFGWGRVGTPTLRIE